jgi:hypothetical protein
MENGPFTMLRLDVVVETAHQVSELGQVVGVPHYIVAGLLRGERPDCGIVPENGRKALLATWSILILLGLYIIWSIAGQLWK